MMRPGPMIPYNSERVRRLLQRMETMICEARVEGRRPARFRASLDIADQEIAHDEQWPYLAFGVHVVGDDSLPPNSIILESAEGIVW